MSNARVAMVMTYAKAEETKTNKQMHLNNTTQARAKEHVTARVQNFHATDTNMTQVTIQQKPQVENAKNNTTEASKEKVHRHRMKKDVVKPLPTHPENKDMMTELAKHVTENTVTKAYRVSKNTATEIIANMTDLPTKRALYQTLMDKTANTQQLSTLSSPPTAMTFHRRPWLRTRMRMTTKLCS